MRKFGKVGVLGIAMTACLAMVIAQSKTSYALGYPDISFDSSQGAGQNLFTSGAGAHYDSATGLLGVSSKALSISFDGVTNIVIGSGTVDYQLDLISSTVNGGTVVGNFGTDGVAGWDLIVRGDIGSGIETLLTGNFSSYTLNGIIGTNIGAGQASFVVTGGSLASYYTNTLGGLVNLTFNVNPWFSATTFSSSFSGQVKGDIAPVPEPASVLLLGSGLAGIGLWGWKRRKNGQV